jgi:hypothetical protein
MCYFYKCAEGTKKAGLTHLLFLNFTSNDITTHHMDRSNIQLVSDYHKTGAYLTPVHADTHQLIIHTRKEVTPKKPALYLMLKAGKQVKYFSSLYPTETPNTYILEADRTYYYLTLTDTLAHIRHKSEGVQKGVGGSHCQCISLGNGCISCNTLSGREAETC